MRREATAAERAASPVPKRITVTGSGIGTGPDGGGVGVNVSGGKVIIAVGVSDGIGVLVGVFGGVPVGVAVVVGVAVSTLVLVGVGEAGSVGVSVMSAGAPWAETLFVASQLGITNNVTKITTIAAITSRAVTGFFIEFLLKALLNN